VSSHDIRAGLYVPHIVLEREIFQHVVNRIFADFTVSDIRVLVSGDTVESYTAHLNSLTFDGGIDIHAADLPTGSPVDALFMIKPGIREIFGRSAYDPPIPEDWAGPVVLEIDEQGRTAPLRHAAVRSEGDGFLFSRNIAPPAGGEGVMGYYPYFAVYQEPGEVGCNLECARYVQNQFGFRRPRGALDLERQNDEILIVVHGGSSAYGSSNSAGLAWPLKLEASLNARLVRETSERRRFRVINMAIPASAIHDCLSRHVMLANRLMPEYVIAHIGWNEARNFGYTDPGSLDRGILLHHHHTTLGQRFWATQGTWDQGDEKILVFDNRRTLAELAGVILDRILQFKRIVAADGGQFIAGVQPMILAKPRLHRLEKLVYRDLLLDKGRASVDLVDFRRRVVAFLERELLAMEEPDLPRLGFNGLIHELNSTDFWFWDFGHTTPVCDTFIAQTYHDVVWRHFQPHQEPCARGG
jgi:hypothetical protein